MGQPRPTGGQVMGQPRPAGGQVMGQPRPAGGQVMGQPRPGMQSAMGPPGQAVPVGQAQERPLLRAAPPAIRQFDGGQAPQRPPGPRAQRPTAPNQATASAPTDSGQPAGTVGRGYSRGVDRTRAAADRSQEEALVKSMAGTRLSTSSSNEGSGQGDSGSDKGETTSVGRATSRGLNRNVSAACMMMRPHMNQKQGESSRTKINIVTNYFALNHSDDWKLHLYDVQYSPEVDVKRERSAIMRQHLQKNFAAHVFDGQNIFSATYIGKQSVYTTKLENDEVYTATVTHRKELDGVDEQFMRFLNLILKRCQNNIDLKLIGRHHFNTEEAVTLDANLGLKVYPGYQTSIRQHESQILLNVDIVHKFQQTSNVLTRISQRGGLDALYGEIIMAPYNHTTYKVEDIDTSKTPKSTFDQRGRQISYAQYYKEKYNITIKNLDQPLIKSSTKNRGETHVVFLVPELMCLTGIPDMIRTNFNKMKQLADYTKMGVDRRVAALKAFNAKLLSTPKVVEDLKLWGLNLSPKLVSMPGRVVPGEKIFMRDEVQYNFDDADWGQGMRQKKMPQVVDLKNWVFIHWRSSEGYVQSFVQTLIKSAMSVGMKIDKPAFMGVRGSHEVEGCVRENPGAQMYMVALPRNESRKYGDLKKALACRHGVLSQFVLAHQMEKERGLMSIATKIVIQMNAKLGGVPWHVHQPVKGMMVVGYDAYHDSHNKSVSYGACVSSMDKLCTRYYGNVNAHHNAEELSSNFSLNIKIAVQKYKEFPGNENELPKHVVVFRDGVGEGQLDYVKHHEIPAIRRQLGELAADRPEKIKLLFIVVTKRINTRLFGQLGPKLVNPPPGTVMDNTITLPQWYDFFIVSQKVTQGTVTPTAYNVLEDQSNIPVDKVQRIAYKMTHMYYNWQGTVRVPAPCLYAHKLAYMTGTGTHELPKSRLLDKLWYI